MASAMASLKAELKLVHMAGRCEYSLTESGRRFVENVGAECPTNVVFVNFRSNLEEAA